MRDTKIWLCFSGGNALGAYHGGVYQAFHEQDITPDRIAGASIGGVTGAIVAGNPRDKGLEALREFWQRAGDDMLSMPGLSSQKQSVIRSLVTGRPGLFHPKLPGLLSLLPYATSDSLFDTAPQRRTLSEIIDFDLVNSRKIPLLITALDTESGEDVVFESGDGLTVYHLMASTALPIAFPPVRIGQRTLIDPGLSANLPVRPLFRSDFAEEVICICIDLLPRAGRPGKSIGE
jgi:NTE family protein